MKIARDSQIHQSSALSLAAGPSALSIPVAELAIGPLARLRPVHATAGTSRMSCSISSLPTCRRATNSVFCLGQTPCWRHFPHSPCRRREFLYKQWPAKEQGYQSRAVGVSLRYSARESDMRGQPAILAAAAGPGLPISTSWAESKTVPLITCGTPPGDTLQQPVAGGGCCRTCSLEPEDIKCKGW